MSHIQRILPMPRHHGSPCPRQLAKASALRSDAAEIAHAIGETPVYAAALARRLVMQHRALTLRAVSAEHWAHGRHFLGREYLISARHVERELLAMGERG